MARPGSVVAAVFRDLAALPVEVSESSEAAAALALARRIDAHEQVPVCVRELRVTMSALRVRGAAAAPAPAVVDEPVERSAVADLTARIDAARRRASSG